MTNYYYYPCFISLSDKEIEEYNRLTEKLHRMSYTKSHDQEKMRIRELLAFERAKVTKNAEAKYSAFENILNDVGSDLQDTILFVSAEQLDKVLMILKSKNISAHKFTEKEDTDEREFLIQHFVNRDYQVLVAIKCLDEGIDIPSAKRAILMASSMNPREYVQRIGRIIRQDKKRFKGIAEIYDLVVKPNLKNYDEDAKKAEAAIFQKEMIRIQDISRNAMNNATVLRLSYDVLREVNQL